jgi:hypothetical protein
MPAIGECALSAAVFVPYCPGKALPYGALLFFVLLSSGFAEFACDQQVNRESVLLALLVLWR